MRASEVDLDVVCHDGLVAYTEQLDDFGSIVCYSPALPQRGSSSAAASDWYGRLEKTLQRVNEVVPLPCKTRSFSKRTSTGHALTQYYGAGPFAFAAAPSGAEALNAAAAASKNGDAESSTHTFKANPRWYHAGRPLSGEDLECVMEIKQAVESAVSEILRELKHETSHNNGNNASEPLFNSVLVNRYPDGRASIRWHGDDERCYGPADSILIASVSLGAERLFELRPKPTKGQQPSERQRQLMLRSGSLLVMAGATQAHWQHAILADDTCEGPRINLTFRHICADTQGAQARHRPVPGATSEDVVAALDALEALDTKLNANALACAPLPTVWLWCLL
eukprot:TRINITY_DN26002_c0_g1_i1.p1 TRINITY_DN26002_c0_g1~~TRINITY_DN26002_c0_g1_i1.p1  ORF type:complete len:338 (+),score=57.33 TRINITY_DN26002_c0_g1_i1:142-1155(+)